MDNEKIIEYLHDLINKNVSAQAILKILSRSEFDEKQGELLCKAQSSVEESLDLLKEFRKEIKNCSD